MALRCDATGDRIGRADCPTGDITIFFRFRPAQVTQTFDVLYYQGASAASTYTGGVMIMFGANAGRIEVWQRHNSEFSFQQSAGQALSAATEYDCCLVTNTGNNQAGRIYIIPRGSGISADRGGSYTGRADGTVLSQRLDVGNDPTGDQAGQTRIWGLKIWNAQLSEAEVLTERAFNRAVRRRDLWGEYSLRNDSFGLTDTSGNGRNLTESGTVTTEDDGAGTPFSPYAPVYVLPSPGGDDGALAGAIAMGFGSAAALIGNGALAGAAAAAFAPTGALTGPGDLVGSSVLAFTPSAVLTGAGALAGSAAMVFAASGTLTGAGAGDLAGSASLSFALTAALQGDGALAGVAGVSFAPSATFAALGDLTGAAALTFTPAGAMLGLGDLAGTAVLGFLASAVLGGRGDLSGGAAMLFSASGLLELPAGSAHRIVYVDPAGRTVRITQSGRTVTLGP